MAPPSNCSRTVLSVSEGGNALVPYTFPLPGGVETGHKDVLYVG